MVLYIYLLSDNHIMAITRWTSIFIQLCR